MMRAILTFHSIETSRSVLSFDPQLFEALLANLAEKAIPICDLDTLLANEKKEGVAISFDDGMKSVYQNALPVLIEHRAPAHIFLTTSAIGEPPGRLQPGNFSSFEMLDWQNVEALHEAGVRVESHTHTHPDMRSLTKDQIAEECGIADEIITSRLGRSPGYFACPFGYHNQLARDCVRGRYSGCVTTELRPLGVNEDTAALPRLDTYYFRSRMLVRCMDSNLMRSYLQLRSRMRKLNGSQCQPADP
jgi:peptidoglycan/xylan/chitin deacetylase (PgdA/CDA1 family)